jgi:hypothetical protein
MGVGYPGSESDRVFAPLAVVFHCLSPYTSDRRFLVFVADASEGTFGQEAAR